MVPIWWSDFVYRSNYFLSTHRSISFSNYHLSGNLEMKVLRKTFNDGSMPIAFWKWHRSGAAITSSIPARSFATKLTVWKNIGWMQIPTTNIANVNRKSRIRVRHQKCTVAWVEWFTRRVLVRYEKAYLQKNSEYTGESSHTYARNKIYWFYWDLLSKRNTL